MKIGSPLNGEPNFCSDTDARTSIFPINPCRVLQERQQVIAQMRAELSLLSWLVATYLRKGKCVDYYFLRSLEGAFAHLLSKGFKSPCLTALPNNQSNLAIEQAACSKGTASLQQRMELVCQS
jgi:hypothetical protein